MGLRRGRGPDLGQRLSALRPGPHGPGGGGVRTFGAPNLTDPIWLYGSDAEALRFTIANARQGVMPRWGHRLDQVEIRMLATYVHSLGGGEATPRPVPAAAAVDAPPAGP